MYALYFNKEKCKLEVKKANKGLQNIDEKYYQDEPVYYNDCYYTCLKRKPLVNLAETMKSDWISEVKLTLEKIESICF